MKKLIYATGLLFALCACLQAGEISLASGGSFDITSKTSFGIDLDNPWRYGLKQELTKFKLRLDLLPYQQLTNRVNSDKAVGFINLNFFDLGFEFTPTHKPNSGASGYNDPDNVQTNRFQTGSFVAGIAYRDWIVQLNAGGNEPFWCPWNKGLEFVNDNVKFSWAYLDSMVDVDRTKKISELAPQDKLVSQYTQDVAGITDTVGLNVGGATVGVMYNKPDLFGVSVKTATQYAYDSAAITRDNKNGLAGSVDFVVTPTGNKGWKVMGSVGGSKDYGVDKDPDPLMAGMQVGYAIPLNDDISLVPFAGSDMGVLVSQSGTPGQTSWEVSSGMTMHWPGQGGWYTDYILDDEGRVFPGMSLAYKLCGTSAKPFDENRHDVKFTLFEPTGDEGVFYGIGSEIIVDVHDISRTDREMLATVYADYSIPGVMGGPGILVPCGTVCYDNVPGDTSGRLNAVKVDGGVKLRNAIANTVFGLIMDSGDLLHSDATYRFGYLKLTAEIKY